MKVKPGAKVKGLRAEIVQGVKKLEPLFRDHGAVLTITSGTDGKHMVGSKHYIGQAVDIRSRGFALPVLVEILGAGRDLLGKDYDFILEADHFHLEYDPKVTYA